LNVPGTFPSLLGIGALPSNGIGSDSFEMSRKRDLLGTIIVVPLWILHKIGLVSDEIVDQIFNERFPNTGESGEAYDAEMEASKNAL